MTDSEKLDLILSRLEKLDKVENDITDIKLTLENEIRVNIQRVAEGHLDLSRNLHEALKIDNEKEMLAIRVSVLETELRRIKTKLEIDGSYRYCKKDSCPYLANEILEEILTDYKVPDYPKYCSLSYEEQCNYVCKFCRTKKYIPTKKEKEGIQKIEKEIYKFAGQLDNLSSNGVGEIFCSPSILDFLHNVKFNKNIKIGLESNGSLFNERNWLKISNLGMYNLEVMILVRT